MSTSWRRWTIDRPEEHFESGVRDLLLAESQYPGWLTQLLTYRLDGLEEYQQTFYLRFSAMTGTFLDVLC